MRPIDADAFRLEIDKQYPFDKVGQKSIMADIAKSALLMVLNNMPTIQTEPVSEAYAKAVWTWLLDYQIKTAKLHGSYSPYEVLSWVINDWRKENKLNQ